MGEKSRGNFSVNACFKHDCANRNKKCSECYYIQGKPTEYKSERKPLLKLSKPLCL
jgi:hypothetical protein